MPLDKETIKQAAIQQWGETIGVGDNQTASVATCKAWCDIELTPQIEHFAQAIYELGYGDGASNDINAQTNYNRGVKEERERCANICYEFDTRQGIRALGFSVAEAIRKG